jgi:hypothetical protein
MRSLFYTQSIVGNSKKNRQFLTQVFYLKHPQTHLTVFKRIFKKDGNRLCNSYNNTVLVASFTKIDLLNIEFTQSF